MLFLDCGVVLWLSFPLVLANMLPVLFGGNDPIDFGRRFSDGRPIFGQGKTWSGFFGGVVGAIVFTYLISTLADWLGARRLTDLWLEAPLDGLLAMGSLAIGALLGDLVKSFVKRRLNLERGRAWLFFDQFDAVIGGFLLTWLVVPEWFTVHFLPGRWPAVVVMLVVYFVTHQALSRWAHRRGLKTNPC